MAAPTLDGSRMTNEMGTPSPIVTADAMPPYFLTGVEAGTAVRSVGVEQRPSTTDGGALDKED
jgi:hypothetical protein